MDKYKSALQRYWGCEWHGVFGVFTEMSPEVADMLIYY